MITKGKSCIFCKIIAREEPASKVYEDNEILAFMSLRPINPGEVLIISKKHIDHFYNIPDDIATKIIFACSKIVKKDYGEIKIVKSWICRCWFWSTARTLNFSTSTCK